MAVPSDYDCGLRAITVSSLLRERAILLLEKDLVGCDRRGIIVWIVPGNLDVNVVDFGGDGSGYLGGFVCSCDSGDV